MAVASNTDSGQVSVMGSFSGLKSISLENPGASRQYIKYIQIPHRDPEGENSHVTYIVERDLPG